MSRRYREISATQLSIDTILTPVGKLDIQTDIIFIDNFCQHRKNSYRPDLSTCQQHNFSIIYFINSTNAFLLFAEKAIICHQRNSVKKGSSCLKRYTVSNGSESSTPTLTELQEATIVILHRLIIFTEIPSSKITAKIRFLLGLPKAAL